mgnify:CR=1 FL=1
MGTLENHILISMPHLKDPYFNESIVLICEHSKDGALGLITVSYTHLRAHETDS